MTKKENNKYTMYKSLLTVLDENREKINAVEGLKTVSIELTDIILKISETDNRYKNLSKGAADNKYNSKNMLIASLLKTANVLYVFAKRTDDFPLKEQSDFTESGFKKGRDNELLQKTKKVVENAELKAGEIISFHKDFNEDLKELKELLAGFENSVSSQSSKSTEKQASREALTGAFKKADDIIKDELDPLIEIIREKDIDLYNQYYAARTIKDLGVRKAVKEEDVKIGESEEKTLKEIIKEKEDEIKEECRKENKVETAGIAED